MNEQHVGMWAGGPVLKNFLHSFQAAICAKPLGSRGREKKGVLRQRSNLVLRFMPGRSLLGWVSRDPNENASFL